jgi:hypothetical protein
MEGQARVLEQRVEPLPLHSGRIEPRKGVRSEKEKGVEAEADQRLRCEGCDQGRLRQPALEDSDGGPG